MCHILVFNAINIIVTISRYADCPMVVVQTSGNDIARAGGEGNIISTGSYYDPRAVCLS
jgi:hypothetical protein